MNVFEYLGYYLRDAAIVGYRMITGKTTRPDGKYFQKRISDVAGNDLVAQMLEANTPFAVGRLGAAETFNINEYLAVKFRLKKKMNPKYLRRLHVNSGFFPATEENCKRFCDLFLNDIGEMDILPTYRSFMEEYILKCYAKEGVVLTDPHTYEPYYFENPWSAKLAGKKVLVISPFARSIEKQYREKRAEIFAKPEVLPEFELHTIKAVQTIAGNMDNRFSDWFEALDYMYQEAMKVEFDVALVGCGVYALPLSALLKRAGKQVIMMCGSTQYLFGIKSARSDTVPGLRALYTDAWIYPDESETPKNASLVEGGCYWKT
ncbi:MAG: hypothetical protein IJA11_00150 [Oscillospiraceae bacterium]|nr:hypothetical protein [Oscillospiraceae bacterium]